MYVPEESASFTPAPEGTHRAVCYRFIDYGTQYSEFYGKSAHKVLISWELTDEVRDTDDGPQPFSVHKNYTWSMNPKANLRRDLESWRTKAFTKDELKGENGAERFDIRNILGKPCLVTIVHEDGKDGVNARVTAVTPLPKGTAKPSPINEPIYLSLDPTEYDTHTFDNLPEKTREKIKRSPEWKRLNGLDDGSATHNGGNGSQAGGSHVELDDEIPF